MLHNMVREPRRVSIKMVRMQIDVKISKLHRVQVDISMMKTKHLWIVSKLVSIIIVSKVI